MHIFEAARSAVGEEKVKVTEIHKIFIFTNCVTCAYIFFLCGAAAELGP
jgi:hypothetical protein